MKERSKWFSQEAEHGRRGVFIEEARMGLINLANITLNCLRVNGQIVMRINPFGDIEKNLQAVKLKIGKA